MKLKTTLFATFLSPLLVLAQSPGVRNAHSMIYHEKDEAIYLFGGATDSEVKGDLWKLVGDKWEEIAVSGPDARTFASMVYDTGGRIILFGGSKVLFGRGPSPDNLLNDTWIFENGSWKEINTQNSPSIRAESASTYDPERNVMVLFGGYDIRGRSYLKLGDTWEFDGSNWKMISQVGPSERNGAAICYDLRLKTTVLFGGGTDQSGYGEGKGETWTWNGEVWVKLVIKQPGNLFNATMVATEKGDLRFGGWNGKARVNELWLLEGNKWEQLSPNESPASRNHASMAYDRKNDRIVLYGGHDGKMVFGGLWQYKEGEWEKLSGAPSRARIANGH